MPYVRLKGIKGLVFVPERDLTPKKYNCKDCLQCGWCSDARCDLCLKSKSKKKKKCRRNA